MHAWYKAFVIINFKTELRAISDIEVANQVVDRTGAASHLTNDISRKVQAAELDLTLIN